MSDCESWAITLASVSVATWFACIAVDTLTCSVWWNRSRYTNAAVALLQSRQWDPAVEATRLAMLWGGWEFAKDAARLGMSGLDMQAIIKHLSIAVTHKRAEAPAANGFRKYSTGEIPTETAMASAITRSPCLVCSPASTTGVGCVAVRLQRSQHETSRAFDFEQSTVLQTFWVYGAAGNVLVGPDSPYRVEQGKVGRLVQGCADT